MTPEDRLASLPIWPGPTSVRRVSAGRTNANFFVQSGGRRYMARLGVDLPHHGIVRRNEARLATLAAELGVGPPIRYAEDGILVADWIDGRTFGPADLRAARTLHRIASLLRTLHSASPPADCPIFDLKAVCRRYLERIPPHELGREHRQSMARMLAGLPHLPIGAVIHADLVPENLIDDGSRLWLVDWEYAGAGHPATDLAILAMNADLDEESTGEFVAAHGLAAPDLVQRLRSAAAIREALWTLVQLRSVGPQGDLPDYSRRCFARLGIER